MRSRRSISDIVAVVLLIVIAIAAAVIIYMWLSGLIGTIHTSTSVTQVKLEIIGANVTYVTYNSLKLAGYNVTAYVYNPPGSPSTSIRVGELEFTNGTLICSNRTYEGAPGHITITPITVTPSGTAEVPFFCAVSQLPPGTPVEIVLFTSEGVQVTYTTTVS